MPPAPPAKGEEVAYAPTCGITLAFRELSFSVDAKVGQPDGTKVTQPKAILSGVTGMVAPGEILAVMGPSGSGKTTLLDHLAGRIESGRVSGEVLLNGCPRNRLFKRISAYVQQEDTLNATLTVYETFLYSARLRLPDSVSLDTRKKMCEELVDELGLRICANTRIGNAFLRGVSGGQRRRTSIGVEMVNEPCVLFLDVPTSGLDSTAALSVMENLKKLASRNRTVITTINQPSSELFRLFDKLLLLSEGKSVYFGPAKEAVPYFASAGYPCPPLSNPADFFLSTINTDFEHAADVDKLQEMFVASPMHASTIQKIDELKANPTHMMKGKEFVPAEGMSMCAAASMGMSKYATSFWTQFRVLFERMFNNNLRNPTVYWVRVAMYALLALVMGTMYFDVGTEGIALVDRESVLFFTVAFLTFMAIAALPAFLEERGVFVRERRNGAYHVFAYVLANSFASIPFVFIISLVTAAILYWMVGLHQDFGRFCFFVLLLFLALYVAESIMVTVSAIVPMFMVGLAAASGLLGWFMLLCGFFQAPENIPPYWKWGYYIAFHTYAFEGFMFNDQHALTFTDTTESVFGYCCPPGSTPQECVPLLPCDFLGDTRLDREFDITDDVRWRDVGVLLAMILVYRALFYLFLRRYQRGSR